MQQNYTAVIKQDAEWWIGWIEEIPGVNCQERSRRSESRYGKHWNSIVRKL
jgi:hypothetical protein